MIKEILNKVQFIVNEQKRIKKLIKRENLDDTHSVLRTKEYIDFLIELEHNKNIYANLLANDHE